MASYRVSVLLLLVFCGLTLAKNLPQNEVGQNSDNIVKCHCMITAEMHDDSPYHNFGVIRTYNLDPLLDTSRQCHHIKHNCKKECGLRTDLQVDVQRRVTLGKVLCTKLGIPTIRGGARVVSQAHLEADGQCGQSAEYRISLEPSHHTLCCANTQAGHTGMRLGWNPDCQGRNFVLV